MTAKFSIAIETTCRVGGVAIGRGDKLLDVHTFDASSRHATALVARLDEMVRHHGATPDKIGKIYVSAGPGSFTGTRIGVTVARTFAQAIPACKLVAVPTAQAIALQAAGENWTNLAVLMDFKEDSAYLANFVRDGKAIHQVGDGVVDIIENIVATLPRPTALAGQGVPFAIVTPAWKQSPQDGITILPEKFHTPAPRSVWQVGQRLADEGKFTDFNHLLPIYARRPEAVRLWEQKMHNKPAAKTK